MRKFKVFIKGTTPYMQHRMSDIKLKEWETVRGTIVENFGLNTEPKMTAAYHAYIDDDGQFYIPSEHFKQCFIKGGAFVKSKVGNSTKSMKNIVAGMWRITPERIPFRMFDEVDTRSAVNNNVKARVIVHRPKWIAWKCDFKLLIDDDHNNGITLETIKAIMGYGGRYLGVGSYRPEHTGEYGRFEIVSIEEEKIKKPSAKELEPELL